MPRLSKAKRKMKADKADAELWYKQHCQQVLAQRPSKKQLHKASLAAAKLRRNKRLSEAFARASIQKTVASMLGR